MVRISFSKNVKSIKLKGWGAYGWPKENLAKTGHKQGYTHPSVLYAVRDHPGANCIVVLGRSFQVDDYEPASSLLHVALLLTRPSCTHLLQAAPRTTVYSCSSHIIPESSIPTGLVHVICCSHNSPKVTSRTKQPRFLTHAGICKDTVL